MGNDSKLHRLGNHVLHARGPVHGSADPCRHDGPGISGVQLHASDCSGVQGQPGPSTRRSGGHDNLLARQLAAVVALVLVAACSSNVPELARPAAPLAWSELEEPAPTEALCAGVQAREERGSCYAAFDDVAEAWQRVVGPLSAECRSVADAYSIRLVPVVPCEGPGGAPADGCAVLDERAVYLLEDRSPAGQVFVAAHEWVHVLAGCALGDSDHDHRDAELWNLEAGVLGLATEDPPVGPCVEVP